MNVRCWVMMATSFMCCFFFNTCTLGPLKRHLNIRDVVMELFYYRRLDVYRDAKQLAINVNEVLKSFPKEERYALTSQLQRASTSVMFNIAEGFGRYSSKERIHFLDIANGSLMEVSSQIDLAEAYHYISTTQREEFDSQILSIVKQLAGLRRSLLQSSNPSSFNTK